MKASIQFNKCWFFNWLGKVCLNVFLFLFDTDVTFDFVFSLLKENTSSEEHVLYVWDHFVSKAAAKNVFIIAHSYGGLSFVELVSVLVFHLPTLPPIN